MSDPHNLQRFVTAQDKVIGQVRKELAAGAKTSHWMWFVFPQIEGLGYSAMARLYAIASTEEARAYLAHPVLGPRLTECTGLVLQVRGRSARAIFGSTDEMKLRSSMTLFDAVTEGQSLFGAVLARYFGGVRDEETLARI
jgi:uncharacterized protein (DUF1810 family)